MEEKLSKLITSINKEKMLISLAVKTLANSRLSMEEKSFKALELYEQVPSSYEQYVDQLLQVHAPDTYDYLKSLVLETANYELVDKALSVVKDYSTKQTKQTTTETNTTLKKLRERHRK